MQIYLDGKLVPKEQAVVSVFDHGFLFGDGVYEVLRTYGRQPFLFYKHQERLRRSGWWR